MKTAVRYCLVCEGIVRGGKCGCDSAGFSANLQPLTFQSGRIVRRAVITAALAGLVWLFFKGL